VSTFTATSMPDARPPYVELKWATGATDTKVYSGTITRNGQPVRIPASVTPTDTAVWKDYDAPYDQGLLYVATIGSSTTPTGVSNETWSTAPGSNGWTSVQNISTAISTVRTNCALNPSFESNVTTGVAAVGAATLSRSTTEHHLGTAALGVTANPVTVTNLVTDPSFTGANPGWVGGAGSFGVEYNVSGGIFGAGVVGSAGTNAAGSNFLNSPAYPVTPGKRYYIGMTLTRVNSAGTVGNTGFLYRWYSAGGSQVGSDVTVGFGYNDGATAAQATNAVAPSGAATLRVYPFTGKVFVSNTKNHVFDAYYGDFFIDHMYVTDGNTGWFSGGSTDTTTYHYDWNGAANASTSTRKTVTTSAGTRLNFSGITPGKKVTLSYYARISAGSTTVSADPNWSTTAAPSMGTVTTTWQRFSATYVSPSTATATGYFDIKAASLGFGDVTLFIDNVLIETSDVVAPYFDGDYSEIPSAAPLGAWQTSWTGAAGVTASTVAFNKTIVSSATPASGWSLTKPFSFVSSSLRFLGLLVPSGGSALVHIAFGSIYVDLVVASSPSSYAYTITDGSSTATMTHEARFTGEVDVAFLNGRVYLNHLDSGGSVSIPHTGSTTVTSISIVLTGNTVMLPFQMVPGIILTTQTLQDNDTLSPQGAWLIHPYNPSASVEVDAGQGCTGVFATAESARELTRTANTSLLAPIGAKRMLAITLGSRKDPAWAMEVSTKDVDAYDAMVELLEDSAPLRFDYPDNIGNSAALCNRGMRIPKGWFSVGDVTEARDGADWASPARRWSLPLDPVAAPTAYPVG
jgi:hypothetical protein